MTPLDDTTPAWLRPARAELARLQPDAARDAELLARLQRLQRATCASGPAAAPTRPVRQTAADIDPPHWLRRLAWSAGGLGATCAALLCAVLLLDPPGTTGRAQASPVAGSGFIALVPEAELRSALAAPPGAVVWLQPAELPRERLALLGLPFDAARADEPVRAELMLNPGGQLLAVRILN